MNWWYKSALGLALPFLCSTALVPPIAASDTSTALPSLDLTITPARSAGSGATIASLGIDLSFDTATIAAGSPIVRIAKVSDNVDTVATTVGQIVARDALGLFLLHHRDLDVSIENAKDSEAGGPTREWYADRAVKGKIYLHYEVAAHAVLPPRGAAPPLELRNDAGGVSGAGNIFLIVPPGNTPFRTRVNWNLSKLPKGSRGISSLGEGASSYNESMTMPDLRMSYFMGGAIKSWPMTGGTNDGFFGGWQGDPAFNASEVMQWTGKLHQKYKAFFSQPGKDSYGVFMRYNPVNAGGGTGLNKSFIITYGAGNGSDVDYLKITLAHEMFHTFQPFITTPAGKQSSWFGEGLAMFYDIVLPLRNGMISPRAYIDNVNFSAARYYSNPFKGVSNAVAGNNFWTETRYRTIAYDRGMMYFFVLNDMVREASAGSDNLDSLMLEMLHRQKIKSELTNDDWEEVLRKHAGPQAVEHFRHFLAGEVPIPSSSSFGPCFTRTTKTVRRYEVGFDPKVLAEPQRIVRGLIGDSAAQKAGLRNGDEIVEPVPQDAIQGTQDALLNLKVRRGATRLTISYLPRGEAVSVYQWVIKNGADLQHCATI